MVSVIVLNYNGGRFIQDCLDSLKKIDHGKYTYEVVVVDNASSDNSVEIIKKYLPWIKFIETGKNLGYAGGNNVGVSVAKGKYLIFLNPDTVVDKNFLKELVDSIEKDKSVGAFSSKVLYKNRKDKINTVGGFWSILGISGSVGEGKRDDDVGSTIYTFYPTGCSMIIDKKLYTSIGKFDDDYFLYCEDPDIGWRLWDNGYKVALAPKSKVYHSVSGSLKGLGKKAYSDTFYYYNARNGLITIAKNAAMLDLFWMIPVYIFSWSALSILFLIRGNLRAAKSVIKGVVWPVSNIGWILEKRRKSYRKKTGKAKTMMMGFIDTVRIFLGSKVEKHFA